MRLVIATPLAIVVDADVNAVSAEDASGRFGILPGHADFLTVLDISVLSWRGGSGSGHCAVRGGVLSVSGGDEVAVSTREAVVDADLDRLSELVLAQVRDEAERERTESTEATRLHLAMIRQISRSLGEDLGSGLP